MKRKTIWKGKATADDDNNDDHLGRRHGWGRTVSSTTSITSLSSRNLVYEAGGCQVVVQISRSGSTHNDNVQHHDNVQLQRTACQFLRMLN